MCHALKRLLAASSSRRRYGDGGLRSGGLRKRPCPAGLSGQYLRPGGTISGPTMMALADFAMYVAVFSTVGWVPLAVTTNLNINFLRKPAARRPRGRGRLLKLGKRLAVGEVTIRSDGAEEPVAHATRPIRFPAVAVSAGTKIPFVQDH